MSITVVIDANVKDFEKWLAFFNQIEDQRQEEGINFKPFQKHQRTTNKLCDRDRTIKTSFFDFFNSPERLAIQQAVIVKRPIITFLKSV
tara:strand:- start:457 stop:723 length:267 start_codon:yes stop_codon:yes gene_type:complete